MQVRFNIVRQTEKAVLVNAMLNTAWFDGNDFWYEKDVWLPKSQIKVEGELVVEIADWLCKKNDIAGRDPEAEAKAEAKEAEMTARYEAVIEKAKALGIKGIRKGMRYATIIAKAQEQGIEFAI